METSRYKDGDDYEEARRFKVFFFRVFSLPRKLHSTFFFSPVKITRLFLLKEVKPSPGR